MVYCFNPYIWFSPLEHRHWRRNRNHGPPKQFLCPNNCGSSFTHRGSLTRHLRYECQQNPRFKCPSCDFRSRWTSDVYKHVRKRHQGIDVRCIDTDVALRKMCGLSQKGKFLCPNCSSSFNWKNNLQRHLRYGCRQEPRFRCPYCAYRSRWLTDVYRHSRKIHNMELRIDLLRSKSN
nr:PREDICTED: zinc finger protein 425-like [Linepithema humile]